MTTRRPHRSAVIAAAAAVASICVPLLAQSSTPADLAARLTGTWKVNRDLSPSIGRGRGRAGAAPIVGSRLVPASYQRGGRGAADTSTAQDLTPEEVAARAAVRQLQQIPELLKIDATADSVTFSETRGTFTYPINNKSTKVNIGDAKVDVKTKWDKLALRQEFNTAQQKLIKMWDVDENGRLVLKLRVESITMNSADAIAVFDKER